MVTLNIKQLSKQQIADLPAQVRFDALQKPEKKVKSNSRFDKHKIFKKKGVKKSPRQLQTARFVRYFNLWVRLSHCDSNGIVKCYTCGKFKHYKDNMHAGHFMGSARMPTKWDEMNVKPQCFTCNTTNEGMHHEFAELLDEQYGKGTAAALKIKSLTYYKYDSFQIEAKIKYYRDAVKILEQQIN